jgi:hypothetical protein
MVYLFFNANSHISKFVGFVKPSSLTCLTPGNAFLSCSLTRKDMFDQEANS